VPVDPNIFIGIHPYHPIKNPSGIKIQKIKNSSNNQNEKKFNTNFVNQDNIHIHIQKHSKSSNKFIPPKPGRNHIQGYRSLYVDRDNKIHSCILSGLGKRKISNHLGNEWVIGHSESLHFKSSTTAHLPSNHGNKSPECICTVIKNKAAQ
ncbi:MAG: hypothetical protein VW204_04985, partial [Pelagibacteraceae bacterium]